MTIKRVTADVEGAVPKPLVMGDYVYHWTFWHGVLIDAVFTPRLAQFVVERRDGGEIVIKDKEYPFPDDPDVQAGHDVVVAGLGDRAAGNMYYSCGLVDRSTGAIRHLSCWLRQFDWLTAHQYFGWRTRREARDCIRAYYAAVFEVLYLHCDGPLGARFEEEIVPIAEAAIKKWKLTF